MDIGFLTEYAIPLIVGICLCVGYIIKNLVPSDGINRFIPLIMGILGILLNFWINQQFTATVPIRGLASTIARKTL